MPRSAPHSLHILPGADVGSGRSSGLTLPDTLKLAAAYGLPAVEIRDHANIRQQVSEVLQRPGPVACNVRISPNQATAPRVSSYQRQRRFNGFQTDGGHVAVARAGRVPGKHAGPAH